jgi:hypothetical protein
MNSKGINGFWIKILAVVTMFIDHAGLIVIQNGFMSLNRNQISDTMFNLCVQIAEGAHLIGRMAFPLFCFLLVEGFIHTHSRTKYLRNLILFGIISEPIYDLAMSNSLICWDEQNVLFELALCLIMLVGLEKIRGFGFIYRIVFDTLIVFICCEISLFCRLDGGILGVLLVAVFYEYRKERIKRILASIIVIIVSSMYIYGSGFKFDTGAIFDLYFIVELIAVGCTMLYDGERGKKGIKYFFYMFYPVHLITLWSIAKLIL